MELRVDISFIWGECSDLQNLHEASLPDSPLRNAGDALLFDAKHSNFKKVHLLEAAPPLQTQPRIFLMKAKAASVLSPDTCFLRATHLREVCVRAAHIFFAANQVLRRNGLYFCEI